MLVLAGLILVLTGSFLAIIGTLGAVGTGIYLKVLPGRGVEAIGAVQRSKKFGRRTVVRGKVEPGPGGTLRAPLSGRDCVWYLATQSAGDGAARATVDRYSTTPFTLADGAGYRLLVGPHCPALEQIAPSWREVRTDGHPWFAEAPGATGEVQVLEFILTGGEDLVAAGEVTATAEGGSALGGEVALSAGGDAAALGDPAGRTFQRDLRLAVGGLALIIAGSLCMNASAHPDQPARRATSTAQ